MQFRHFLYGLFLTIITCSVPALAQPASSVLKTGAWVKIGVTKTGVHRLDYATLTKQVPAFANADPRRFRLYGNGGAPLPQANAAARLPDLTENAVLVTGEADGRFDRSDALLFFGQSPHTVRYDSTARRLTHQINPYCDTTFYFLTVGNEPGLRIENRSAGSATGLPVISSFTDYAFREEDLTNRIQSGREWWGDYFGVYASQAFTFDLSGYVANTPVMVTSSVMAEATVPTKFIIRQDNRLIGTQEIGAVTDYRYDRKGIENRQVFSYTPATMPSPLKLTLDYDKSNQSGAQGYLNFLAIQFQRELRQYAQPVWVRGPAGRYGAKAADANLRIWDISDPFRIVAQGYALTGQEATWSGATRSVNDYWLFTDTQTAEPASVTPIPNQNIRAEATPNLLIVTPAAWKSEAERLATFRRSHDGLTVLVVTTQQVYNEFASGQPDVSAIRDMARYFNQKQPDRLRYLLLFGDATYDYRNKSKILTPAEQANTIPVYESRESLNPVLTYSSDDYFGFLKDTDGEWAENPAGDQLLDIGVGRLPVKSLTEAKIVVDKLINYSGNPTLAGEWRTRLMLVADDGDDNMHQLDADRLARQVETQYPAFRPERVFVDAFPIEKAPTGQKAPAVNQVINRGIDDGRLIINYAGHGGVSGWAEEQILTLQDIFSWKNRRLPLLVTATCEFGRYDDPGRNSGAELALVGNAAGCIGLLTTTRPVFANTNFLLNQAFYERVFRMTKGGLPRLGDIMRETKNNSLSGSLNRNFALLGDPSMQLAYPQARVNLTHLNGQPLSPAKTDTLRALQAVELKGEIRDPAGNQLLSDFTGSLRLTLYDKPVVQTTLGTNGPKMNYPAYISPLYTGQVKVVQGRFMLRFRLPNELNKTFGLGKVVTYAIRADSLQEAAGSYENFSIGGLSAPDSVDTQPPVIKLAIASQVLSEEPLTVAGPDVTLVGQLSDNWGISTARSSSHNLTVQLNTQPPVIANESYTALDPNGRQGELRYTFRGLEPGIYTVQVKASDISNNSAGASLTFKVSEKPALAFREIRAFPNPFSAQVTLEATQNRPGESIEWVLSIYDVSGRLQTERQGTCDQCPSTLPEMHWDGRGNSGSQLPNGMYLYRLRLQSLTDKTEAVQSGRLLMLK
ncbi:type IX secretion system sortase PorU [Nibrella viscosa]|uniref:Type IX secretion system sortase PorU n=1 Tax=Nibrella viscosa TaxID=1084524 RepID=A0ABP8KRL6_9BACT